MLLIELSIANRLKMNSVKLIQNLDDCLDFIDNGFFHSEVRQLHLQGNGSTILFEDMFSGRKDLCVTNKKRFLVSVVDIDQIEAGFSLLTLFDFEDLVSIVVVCNRNGNWSE